MERCHKFGEIIMGTQNSRPTSAQTWAKRLCCAKLTGVACSSDVGQTQTIICQHTICRTHTESLERNGRSERRERRGRSRPHSTLRIVSYYINKKFCVLTEKCRGSAAKGRTSHHRRHFDRRLNTEPQLNGGVAPDTHTR